MKSLPSACLGSTPNNPRLHPITARSAFEPCLPPPPRPTTPEPALLARTEDPESLELVGKAAMPSGSPLGDSRENTYENFLRTAPEFRSNLLRRGIIEFRCMWRGGGVLMILHAEVMRPLTSHPYRTGKEHAGIPPDQARSHQGQTAVMCSVSLMSGEPHPARIVRPD